MPTSYQGPHRGDDTHPDTHSQTLDSNLTAGEAVVGDILQAKGRDLITIRPQQDLHAAVQMLRDHRIGALVVTDAAGVLQGILSERDIVRKLAETPGRTLPHQVSDVMTSRVETTTPDEPLVSVMRRMSAGRFRHMPVMDGTGLAGIVTIGDVVQHRVTALEYEALRLKQLIVG